jgi:predicted transposase/invertase (TIGR01784 family)
MAVYINPYTDFGFKKLFGEEANKEVLIDFLNALLPSHHQISDLTFHNVEALPDAPDERKAFFDIHCKAVSGERFIVEIAVHKILEYRNIQIDAYEKMQKAKVKYFKDRSLYYITYPIREQAQRGDWNFHLNPIYFIAVLDFLYDDNIETAKFLRNVTLKDEDNDPFYDKLRLIYLQMDAFTKKEHELKTQIDKWAYFLKNLEKFEDIPHFLNEPVFERAFATAKFTNLNKTQQLDYENSRLQYIGSKEIVNTAKEEGRAEERAIAAAKEEQMILKMNSKGVEISEIAEFTGKTEREVKQILAKHGK